MKMNMNDEYENGVSTLDKVCQREERIAIEHQVKIMKMNDE